MPSRAARDAGFFEGTANRCSRITDAARCARFTTSSRKARRLAACSIRPADASGAQPIPTLAQGTDCRAYLAAARLISSSDAGFSNAEVSPSFSPRYAARDAAHHFRVSRFRYVADENHFARRERFAEIACDVLFNLGGEAQTSPFASFFKTQKQTSASPLMESGTPIAAASLTLRDARRELIPPRPGRRVCRRF